MSFSQDVKEELCSSINDRDKEYGCLYGMLLFCQDFGADRITFRTENPLVAQMFTTLCERVTSAHISSSQLSRRGRALYSMDIPEEGDREEIIYRFRVSSRSLIHRIQRENLTNNNIFAFLAGAFLSCGSVEEPLKQYHLEFAVPYEALCGDLKDLIADLGISAKQIERTGQYILYFKSSESIEDILTMMGASRASVELMNVKILKDVRNKANRIANCDTANIERTLKASRKQIEDIQYIMDHDGYDDLSEELKNMALVRLENPDISLKELGEMLDKPVGRSGANHRLRRLSEIAELMRNGNGNDTQI
ncbi:MAG: DNA-binding protein WhiA [Oscillospiraceae bacterium]|nr:DNA-binding protein WhiA [Oscillospiraceae bacterium]